MGIDKRKTKLTAFALGATWAGMVGVIFAAKTTFINPASFTFLSPRSFSVSWCWVAWARYSES